MALLELDIDDEAVRKWISSFKNGAGLQYKENLWCRDQVRQRLRLKM